MPASLRLADQRRQLDLEIPPPPTKERGSALKSFHTRRQPMRVQEALAGEKAARRQDAMVLHVLERARHPMTPSEVHAVLVADVGRRAPLLTSVRRSLTTMSMEDPERWPSGAPLRHNPKDRRPGLYGRTESTWELRGTR